MSGFGKLYRELCNNHPVGNLTKTTDNVNFFDERIEVMRMCGLGPGSKGASSSSKKGPVRAPRNRHHGKEARYRAPEARLKALKEDNGVTAVKRLEIARAVNEVTKSFEVSKQLGTFVKEKKPFPQKLLRELLGKKAMRGGSRLTQKGKRGESDQARQLRFEIERTKAEEAKREAGRSS